MIHPWPCGQYAGRENEVNTDEWKRLSTVVQLLNSGLGESHLNPSLVASDIPATWHVMPLGLS